MILLCVSYTKNPTYANLCGTFFGIFMSLRNYLAVVFQNDHICTTVFGHHIFFNIRGFPIVITIGRLFLRLTIYELLQSVA